MTSNKRPRVSGLARWRIENGENGRGQAFQTSFPIKKRIGQPDALFLHHSNHKKSQHIAGLPWQGDFVS